jgi:hypothetical protein
VATGEGTDCKSKETAKIEGESGRGRGRSGEGREEEGDGELLCSVEEEGLESTCKAAEGVVQERRPGRGTRRGKEPTGRERSWQRVQEMKEKEGRRV